jgi:glutaminase
VSEAYERFRANAEGENSRVYPALAAVPEDAFGVCVVGTTGSMFAAGDADHEFTIMSVSKPFVFALVCQSLGPEEARQRLGVNSTGLPFNSLVAVEQSPDGRTNPMVNAGAIAASSLVPGSTADEKWETIREGLSRFAGRQLTLNTEVYRSASETNHRNQSTAQLLQTHDRIYFDPAEATDVYTKQCSLNVSAHDLAVMGATLADGGVNPLTRIRDARRSLKAAAPRPLT